MDSAAVTFRLPHIDMYVNHKNENLLASIISFQEMFIDLFTKTLYIIFD